MDALNALIRLQSFGVTDEEILNIYSISGHQQKLRTTHYLAVLMLILLLLAK